jgi:hypothetical protein
MVMVGDVVIVIPLLASVDGLDRAIAAQWWQDRSAFTISPVRCDAQTTKKAKKSTRLSSGRENMTS